MDRLRKFKEAQALKQQQAGVAKSSTRSLPLLEEADDAATNIHVGHSADALALFSLDSQTRSNKETKEGDHSSTATAANGVKLTLRDSEEDIFARHRRKKRLQAEGKYEEAAALADGGGEDVFENQDLAKLQKEEALAGVKRARYGSVVDGYDAAEKALRAGQASTITTGLTKYDARGNLVETTGGVVARLAQAGSVGAEEEATAGAAAGKAEVTHLSTVEMGGTERAQYAVTAPSPENSTATTGGSNLSLEKKKVKGMSLLAAKKGGSGSHNSASSKAAEVAKARRAALLEKMKVDDQEVKKAEMKFSGVGDVSEGSRTGFTAVSSFDPKTQNAAQPGHIQELVSLDTVPVEIVAGGNNVPSSSAPPVLAVAEPDVEHTSSSFISGGVLADGTSVEASAASWTTGRRDDQQEEVLLTVDSTHDGRTTTTTVATEVAPPKKMSAAAFLMKNFGGSTKKK